MQKPVVILGPQKAVIIGGEIGSLSALCWSSLLTIPKPYIIACYPEGSQHSSGPLGPPNLCLAILSVTKPELCLGAKGPLLCHTNTLQDSRPIL